MIERMRKEKAAVPRMLFRRSMSMILENQHIYNSTAYENEISRFNTSRILSYDCLESYPRNTLLRQRNVFFVYVSLLHGCSV